METDLVSVNASTPQEEVAALMSKYDYIAMPVVNDKNQILGVITIDDIMDVMEEEANEDIMKMAGTSDEELETDSPFQTCKARLPWLLITLCTGFVTSAILKYFMASFESIAVLVFFVPVVCGMGGNAGVQASTLAIRALSLDNAITLGDVFKKLWKEIAAGALMGAVCGLVIGFWAQYLIVTSPNPPTMKAIYLSITVGIAMLCTMSFSTTYGALVPIVFNKFKIDPAVASGPFVTSCNDIFALLIYYAVSSLLIFVILK